jgi:hypothetical protein
MPWLRRFAKAAGNNSEVQRIRDLSVTMQGRIRKAFLRAVRDLGERLDLNRIAELLRAGRTAEAIAAVDVQLIADGMVPVAHAVTEAALTAARAMTATMREMPALTDLNVSFGITNPSTIQQLSQYEFGLIRDLTADARRSVGTAITNGVSAGRNPLDTARDVKQFIGLTQRQTQAVQNYRSALENMQSDALDRALRDKRFDPSVARAIKDQQPLSSDQVDRMVERYQQRYLQYRSQTIARTESIRAVSNGNHAAWTQQAQSGKVDAESVTRQWVYTHDSKTREAHREIPGMNPDGVGLDEAFDTPDGPLLYPGDPLGAPEATINCRCAVIYRYLPA